MGRQWDLYASQSRGTYWHVGERRWVELHGLPHPVVAVLVEEIEGDPNQPAVTHYGWERSDRPGKVTLIWPRATADRVRPWMSLDLCFAYGMQAAIDHGEGRMVALRVTEATRE